jgi:anti-sigma regulatory factor (Ser/Thr protein kinase)
MGKKKHELIPSARRLITSLRDMGYDFAAAVADVVDNSIEANATKVDIAVHFEGDDSWVRITDNGTGMKPAQIREALRYGAEREYDAKEALGKFGLGLKTASMSQCQRLTVASRSSVERAEVFAYSWNLDHVMATNKWEILEVDRDENPDLLHGPLLEHTGTTVLWQRLDRILGYKHPYGEMAKKRLSGMCRELEEHLAMVFHRYISGEAGRRKVRLTVNGNPVRAWDPFVRQETGTRQLESVTLHYDHDGVGGDILIEPYVLPHQDDFSTPQAHAAAAGPLRWNRQQGFYIYRANRMIQSGGWSNLRTMDEHTKLARVAVSFDPRLDEAFRINVAKMRVQLPQQLREQFEKAIGPVIKIAQTAYRRSAGGDRGAASPPRSAVGAEAPAKLPPRLPPFSVDAPGHSTLERASPPSRAGNGRLWTMEELRQEAERVATTDERPVIRTVFDRLIREKQRD